MNAHTQPVASGAHYYRGYEISRDYTVAGPCWVFAHEDYDPTPIHPDGDAADNRAGYATSLSDAFEQIDEIEDREMI